MEDLKFVITSFLFLIPLHSIMLKIDFIKAIKAYSEDKKTIWAVSVLEAEENFLIHHSPFGFKIVQNLPDDFKF